MAKKRKRKSGSAKKRKAKGTIPLPILKKRLAKLSRIVASRS